MKKDKFREFARLRGYSVRYSGKLRKFFLDKFHREYCFVMDIHSLINSKSK